MDKKKLACSYPLTVPRETSRESYRSQIVCVRLRGSAVKSLLSARSVFCAVNEPCNPCVPPPAGPVPKNNMSVAVCG